MVVIALELTAKKKNTLSREELEGNRIWNLIFQRNKNFGARYLGIHGMMGSGKTSLMGQMLRRIKKTYPDEQILWREPINSPLQIRNMDVDYQILCQENYPIQLVEIKDKEHIPIKTDITIFSDIDDLLNKIISDKVNVVYFNKNNLYSWITVMDKLRLWGTWQTIFFVEFEDICPQNASGEIWHNNKLFANSSKEIRKGFVNMIYDTQNPTEIDFYVRSKTMITIYLFGSKKDPYSPVYKGAIHNLSLGQGWIDEGHTRFGIIDFEPIYPKNPVFAMIEKKRDKTDRKKKR